MEYSFNLPSSRNTKWVLESNNKLIQGNLANDILILISHKELASIEGELIALLNYFWIRNYMYVWK